MKKSLILLTLALASLGTAAFAADKVSVNPVTQKPVGIRQFTSSLFLVGSYDKDGKGDFAIIDRGGVVGHNPDMFGIGVKKSRATAANILASKAFTVSFPDSRKDDQMAQFDFMGSYSHAKNPEMDKIKESGIAADKSDAVNAPVPTQFPYVLHCDLVNTIESGDLYFFVGEVKKVEADKSYFDAEGHFNLDAPVYAHHMYARPSDQFAKPGTLHQEPKK